MEHDPALPWREIRGEGFNAHIGPVRFAPLSEARFHAALELGPIHMNSNGVCHGGVLMSVADLAMGAGSFAAGGEHPCATIAFDAQFLAPAREGETLLADARQLRRARELSFMECTLWSGGRQVMRASGIWKYLSGKGPAARPGRRS
jgi:uncharacterized protein (TIGR00369 family)